MKRKNDTYYNNNISKSTFKNKLHNPCSWESPTYKKNLIYKNMQRDKKNIYKPFLPNGPAGAKSCLYNCPINI